MRLVEKNLATYIKPYSAKERNYAIFGTKLLNEDLSMFNNFVDRLINRLKTNIIIFYSVFLLTIIIFVMTIFSSKEYVLMMLLLTVILLLFTFYTFAISHFTYLWIGIYERSWIKLLKTKNMLNNLSSFHKIVGKTTSIVYPQVKIYLETNKLSLIITENDISSVGPLSEDLRRMRKQHLKFDNSIFEVNETI